MTTHEPDIDKIMSEFEGCVFRVVPGFYEKYFHELQSRPSELDCRALLAKYPASWHYFNVTAIKELWLALNGPVDCQVAIDGAEHGPSRTIIYLNETQQPNSRSHTGGPMTLVVGLVETGPSTFSTKQPISKLFTLATRIFNTRPDRQFLHVLHFYNMFEPWVFDRAGAYSGATVDVLRIPDNGAYTYEHALATYRLMTWEEYGCNSLHSCDANGSTLVLRGTSGTDRKFIISDKPLVEPEYLLGSGTTCYQAHEIDSPECKRVVKFYWSKDPVDTEVAILRKLQGRGISGVPELNAFTEITNVASLRNGLTFAKPWPSCESDGEQNVELDERPGEVQQHLQIQQEKFENRTFRCLVTSPMGRPLDSFRSPQELLTILRDIAKTLRRIYLDANVLHRDIAPKNIIINDLGSSQDRVPYSGLLIDYDHALDLDNVPELRSLIGSEGFMAIGILGDDDHTYRHDLESLFYVFIWMAICHNGVDSKTPPASSRLHKWLGMDWDEIYKVKLHDLQPENFSRLVEEEFTALFRSLLPLAHTLHDLLFPLDNGKMSFRSDLTPESVNRLYDGMIAAFEQYLV